jgi:hypothetical protein
MHSSFENALFRARRAWHAVRYPKLVFVALLGLGFVAWLTWYVSKMQSESIKQADWKRIAPNGAITKGVIWLNPEGVEISGRPEDQSGLVIESDISGVCTYAYSRGEQLVFHQFFNAPGIPFQANFMSPTSGEMIWQVTFIGSSAYAKRNGITFHSAPDKTSEQVVRMDIEETRPMHGGTKVTTSTRYYPETNEVRLQELRNGAPWNGVFFTPTIPHWRVDLYKDGVATELGKDLNDAESEQIENRYRQHADKDYAADVRNTVQLHNQEIQSELSMSVSFTAHCPVD